MISSQLDLFAHDVLTSADHQECYLIRDKAPQHNAHETALYIGIPIDIAK